MYWATRYGESDLFHRATHDDLTGLANRALFMDRLHAAMAAARRQEARLAVMLLDMDGLKQINDGHGHAAGDATLMEFAARLNQTVGERELVARLGGDEFAVLLPHAGEVDDIYALEQRLRPPGAAFEVAGLQLRLSASWGVAQFPRDADDADELLALADERMFSQAGPQGPGRRRAGRRRPLHLKQRVRQPRAIGAAAHTARCPAGC
jgi:diguanylate cyclase (GGDEF)-like protein